MCLNDKLKGTIDKASSLIEKIYESRIEYRKNIKNGIKFLGECALVLPKEVLEYYKNKNNK